MVYTAVLGSGDSHKHNFTPSAEPFAKDFLIPAVVACNHLAPSHRNNWDKPETFN